MEFCGEKLKEIIIAAGVFLSLFLCAPVYAANVGGVVNFNVDKDFDAFARNQTGAVLVKTSPRLYFYVEKGWWDAQPQAKQNEVLGILDLASNEFDSRIYPILTSMFGSEWNPGVDGDARITILFHAMNSAEGGYFREADEYVKLQIPISNEREMFYVSLDNIDNISNLKRVLAHELVHLITFSQKNLKFDVSEDTWLNEARADYTSTILGYDDNYSGSNLHARVKDFVQNPSDSVTEWLGTKYDYASVSLFTHYLIDHYSVGILMDSLKSEYTGVESINYALQKSGYKETFSEIFSDWAVAVVLSNCSAGSKYCYLSQHLRNFKLSPSLNFLPLTGDVSLSVSNVTKSWSGNWLKFIGGSGNLKLNFSSLKGLNFKIPYIIEDSAGTLAVELFDLDVSQKGTIEFEKFGTDYKSLTIMPLLQLRSYQKDGFEPTYPFTYSVYITGDKPATGEQELIQKLLDQIVSLKAQIAKILAERGMPAGNGSAPQAGCKIYNSLSIGASGPEVSCLQNFLRGQGAGIYPEGLVTGAFGALTQQAVIRFQEKYASEILAPFGLAKGTGIVGQKTRDKINQMIGQ